METNSMESKVRSFGLPKFEKRRVMQYLTVVSMTGVGIGLMLGGCLAWIFGEELLLLAAFVSGAVFVGAGGIGFMKCLDDLKS